MVFYRGLEHLIKDFYSACLILNRSLNCRASKCQCSLNIYIPSSKRKTAKKWPRNGENPDAMPSCFTGKSWGMMGVCFSLLSGTLREMWQLRAREK